MKLLPRYALQCGLKIGKQFLYEKFYPIGHDGPYLTIQGGSGMPGKNYPYFNEVMDVLSIILNKYNIRVVQVGGGEDPGINHCINLQGKTDIHQTNYIISRSSLHIGNDSWIQHRCGEMGVPLVELFGTTSKANHAPYRHNPKSVFLESHRQNKNPTFQVQENPPTISFIRPEEVINAILSVLGASGKVGLESLLFGGGYQHNVIEWVPNSLINPELFKGQAFIARLDYEYSDENQRNLATALQYRPHAIVTNGPLDINWVMALKPNIPGINYEITDATDPNYIRSLKRTGVKLRFFCREPDEVKLSDIRTKFLDITVIEKMTFKTKDNFFEESARFLNKTVDKDDSILQNTMFRSKKFILSQGKIYLSKAMYLRDQPTEKFELNVGAVIDCPEFWEETDHFYIFKQ